jgi:hypothetical protein
MICISRPLRRVNFRCPLWRPGLAALLCLMACNSNSLTRSRASEAISSSDEFQKPVSITLLPEYRQSLTLIGSQTTPKTEVALERFLESRPELAALRHLGLVELSIKSIEHPDSASSPVTVATSLTSEGQVASRQWQQSGNGWTIPIAKRELVEVTGMAGAEGESKQSRAEYIWRWQPTDVGASFDTSSQAHQNLPASIRKSFGGGSFADALRNVGQLVLFDSSKTQKATATLQLYDDGWRVTQAGT